MSTSLELAQRLEAARLASGLTLQALTEQAGVSRQAVYRLFKGNDVQLSTLLAVMAVLELDLATVPRALKRGLPELSQPVRSPLRQSEAEPAVVQALASPTHVMSAVQRRLLNLKEATAATANAKTSK